MCLAVGNNVREICVFVFKPAGYTNGYSVSIIFFSVPCTLYPCEAVTVLGFPCIGLDIDSAKGNSTDELLSMILTDMDLSKGEHISGHPDSL